MTRKRICGGTRTLLLVAVALVLIGIGIWIGRSTAPETLPAEHRDHAGATEEEAATVWTCSMHPQIRQPEPGECPICGMDLIPASDGEEDDLGPRMLSMTEAAAKLAEVRTSPVERRFVDVRIPLVGKVDYDERRVRTISAWVPGRLERLFVDYTGIPVNKGDHLVKIYSPELYAAQEELLQARRAVENLRDSASAIVRRSTRKTVEAAREKLRLLGLDAEQIREIEQRGTPSPTIQINAPEGGIVVHKNAKEGQYVKTGEPIYTVADLSMVWAMLDVYETDITWLRYGQEVEIKAQAYGDRAFMGWISFIDPILNPRTRTIQVRVVVDNPNGLLRPNMFVRAEVEARAAEDGEVLTRNLRGKWICPMHPEVMKDASGKCDVCGMPLVRAEELGYVREAQASAPLVVPASAVLTTGERAVAYVRVPQREKPVFQGVEVALGPRAGDYYVVLAGLAEGQEVVTNGNFKIDSALQLEAKASMMNPPQGASASESRLPSSSAVSATPETPPTEGGQDTVRQGTAPAEFIARLAPLYESYLNAQRALAGDKEKAAREALKKLAQALPKVDSSPLEASAQEKWTDISRRLIKDLKQLDDVQNIQGLRDLFIPLSRAMIDLERAFGHPSDQPHRIAFCPMANGGEGAAWLQTGKEVNNPYYGSAMLRCGEIRAVFPPPNPGE